MIKVYKFVQNHIYQTALFSLCYCERNNIFRTGDKFIATFMNSSEAVSLIQIYGPLSHSTLHVFTAQCLWLIKYTAIVMSLAHGDIMKYTIETTIFRLDK